MLRLVTLPWCCYEALSLSPGDTGLDALGAWDGGVRCSLSPAPPPSPWADSWVASLLSTMNLRAASEEMAAFKRPHLNAGLPLHEVQRGIRKWLPHTHTLGGGWIFCLARGLHFGILSTSWLAPGGNTSVNSLLSGTARVPLRGCEECSPVRH